MKEDRIQLSRRSFLGRSMLVSASAAVPVLIPASVLGQSSPSSRITIGCIGVGRMGLWDLRDVIGFSDVQVVAVCDVDSRRAQHAKDVVDEHYRRQTKDNRYSGCLAFGDYRQLIDRPDIDAVLICTPDHWHAMIAIEAARAGKDIFLQKPLTYTLREGRLLSDTVRRYGRVFQVGSQQRSDALFRQACELVRNGRVGRLLAIEIGMDQDPATGPEPGMSVPPELDYERWLGPAPWASYTEKRVHPRTGYGRPGWLRIRDYCLGMITGWGSHHIDIAHWAMDVEHSGPVEVRGRADYPQEGLWDVHGSYWIEYKYANGVVVTVTDNRQNPQGVKFIGDEGWIHVRRGAIDAGPKSLLTSPLGPGDIRLYRSDDHKRNFLDCIRTRQTTIAPVEVGHRSCSACILGDIAMKTGQTLRWDPTLEQFLNSDTANRMLSRASRRPWTS